MRRTVVRNAHNDANEVEAESVESGRQSGRAGIEAETSVKWRLAEYDGAPFASGLLGVFSHAELPLNEAT